MFCATIYFIILLLLKTIIVLFLLFVLLIIVLKIYADPVKAVCKCTTKLHGKVVLVTGGNSGIGLETARDLARRGARVIIASRNTEKSAQAVADIIETTGNTQVEHRYLDLSKFSSVKEFADDFNHTVPRLDILVSNAGCAAIKHKITDDGLHSILQINYYSGVLLTNLLLKKLEASKPSRIVVVSSYAHFTSSFDAEDLAGKEAFKKKRSSFEIYSRSKLYQIMWTKALAKRLPSGVTVNVLHPGIIKTSIYDKVSPFYKKLIHNTIDLLFKTPREGAQTIIHLSVATELEHATGGYYTNCRADRAAKITEDENAIGRLWNETIAFTKID